MAEWEFTVFAANGAAINGAKVSIDGQVAETNAVGKAWLPASVGGYTTYSVTAVGYESTTGRVARPIFIWGVRVIPVVLLVAPVAPGIFGCPSGTTPVNGVCQQVNTASKLPAILAQLAAFTRNTTTVLIVAGVAGGLILITYKVVGKNQMVTSMKLLSKLKRS